MHYLKAARRAQRTNTAVLINSLKGWASNVSGGTTRAATAAGSGRRLPPNGPRRRGPRSSGGRGFMGRGALHPARDGGRQPGGGPGRGGAGGFPKRWRLGRRRAARSRRFRRRGGNPGAGGRQPLRKGCALRRGAEEGGGQRGCSLCGR